MTEKFGIRTAIALAAGLIVATMGVGAAVGQTNQAPTAVAGAAPTVAEAGTLILFQGVSSSDPDGTIVEYSWDFGDGSPDVSGPLEEAAQVYHAYAKSGIYTARLTVTDDAGASSEPDAPEATVTVMITPSGIDGAALFAENCSACHTTLNVAGRGLDVPELIDVMTIGSMKDVGEGLTADEIEGIAFYIVGSLGEHPSEGTTTTTTLPESANAAKMYTYTCSGCHGGAGDGGIGPSLEVSTVSEQEMIDIITNGVGTMPGLSNVLTPDQIRALGRYAVTFQSPTATTTTTEPPTTTNGSRLYRSQCAVCHGKFGTGGIGPSVQASKFTESETATIVTEGSGLMPAYRDILTQEQIASVSAYSVGFQTGASTGELEPDIAGVAVEGPGPEVYAKNCAACHGAGGEGGVGPSLLTSSLDLPATTDAVANGIGSMPGFGGMLSPEEVDAVSAFSVALQGGGAASATGDTAGAGAEEAPPALPTGEGADLYAANCAVCHGPEGEGASAAPINVPFENEQLVEIIRVGIADMPGFAGMLNEGQITVLANYVHALAAQAAPTTTLPPATDEFIVAIQPSKYVEFDVDRTSIPLDETIQVALALGSMAGLAVLAYWQIREARREGDGDQGGTQTRLPV